MKLIEALSEDYKSVYKAYQRGGNKAYDAALQKDPEWRELKKWEEELKNKNPKAYKEIWSRWIDPEEEISMNLNHWIRRGSRDKFLASREETRKKVGPRDLGPYPHAQKDPKGFEKHSENARFYIDEDYEELVQTLS
jgi:hypothetical protein